MRWIKGATVVLTLVSCTAACGAKTSPGGAQTPAAGTAAEHRAQWEAAKVNDYSWSFLMRCMSCGDYPGPTLVKVLDGKPVEVRGTDPKGNVDTFSIAKIEDGGFLPLTVDDLFDVLDEAYARNAQVVEVTYDPELGYPTEISIDPNYGCQTPEDGCSVSDDETGYSVKSFEPA
jgi:hypothetical protein